MLFLNKLKNKINNYFYKRKGIILYGDAKKITFSKTSSFGGEVAIYGTDKVTIGEHTMIGMRTIIHTSTHDYNLTIMNQVRIDRPVFIGNNVWIGAGCIILPGVIIEDGAVIGAGSVVNKSVRKNQIVAGNPIRLIKIREEKSNQSIEAIKKMGHIEKWL